MDVICGSSMTEVSSSLMDFSRTRRRQPPPITCIEIHSHIDDKFSPLLFCFLMKISRYSATSDERRYSAGADK